MTDLSSPPDLPLHFLIRPESLPHLDALIAEGVDAHTECFGYGPENWGLQTYVHAKRAGWNVTAGTACRTGAINLGHVSLLTAFQAGPRDLIVGIRADYRPSILADCHVVQNQLQADANSFWIPHWPQPGIIPRSPERPGLQRAAYFGHEYYLDGGAATWKSKLSEIGIEFDCPPQSRWHDYSEVDLVVAVRTFDGYPYPRKPPSKLFNAWIAGAPALVGPESAYQQVGQPGRDYLVARTMEEAIQSITQLKQSTQAYSQLIQAGNQRAHEFTREKILTRWAELLQSQIRPRWEQAQATGIRRKVSWYSRQSLGQIRSVAVQWGRRLFGKRKLSR